MRGAHGTEMMTDLTLEAAKAYVLGHHETNSESADIEGAAIFTNSDGVEIARLNVTVTNAAGLKSVVQWEVWSEVGALYGEC